MAPQSFFTLSAILVLLTTPLIYSAADLPRDILEYGDYIVGLIQMILGILISIGAFGFFIASSARHAQWPYYIRRTFFGIFIFSSILFQILFNVINLPRRQLLICKIGSCFNHSKHKNT